MTFSEKGAPGRSGGHDPHSQDRVLHDSALPGPALPGPALPGAALLDPRLLDPGLLAALTGPDAARERAVALRTRRAVYKALVARRADKQDGRRNLLVAMAMIGALALALAPALWAGIDDMVGGETLLDLPGMLVLLGVTLCAAVAAVLFLMGDDRRTAQPSRGQRRSFAPSRR